MKLAYVDLCGFRGYRKQLRIDFGRAFTIIDGRNGVGKSSIFDAIEYALTGTIAKYGEQTAGGETVADYIWWRGHGACEDQHVEVGFVDGDDVIAVRRSMIDGVEDLQLQRARTALCIDGLAPKDPLPQLCRSVIIRDEHITTLSMELKETERFTLLREALGAGDAEEWLSRAARLSDAAKKRVDLAEKEVAAATAEVATAARRVDEVQARMVAESAVSAALARAREYAPLTASPAELLSHARSRITALSARVDAFQAVIGEWATIEERRAGVGELEAKCLLAKGAVESAEARLRVDFGNNEEPPEADQSNVAALLSTIIKLGRDVGLQEGCCPLCRTEQSRESFESGLEAAESMARRLDEAAVKAAQRRREWVEARGRVAGLIESLRSLEAKLQETRSSLVASDERRKWLGIAPDETADHVNARLSQGKQLLSEAQQDLRVIETLQLNAELERAIRTARESRARLGKAQERLGKAAKSSSAAKLLNDATRRSASETLDVRLERVLPLMAELYRRLRPHPVWDDIEYSIRGDVRRFMKLQVGDGLNPQFLFSSGQRRATGLAFLLSVNLSLAWSRWKSVLLDDPVQHIDDFRAVHLAELLAQLVSSGRQVVCAVEDAALADLMCRRLPISQNGDGKRLMLGSDSDGAIGKSKEQDLPPAARNSVVGSARQVVGG